MNAIAAPESDETLFEAYRSASSETDRRLIADRLFARHYVTVAKWCYRFTGDRESAADLAQEVFLKAHRSLGTFQSSSRFSTWLYSIARNEAINRTRRVEPETDGEEALIEVPAALPDPETAAVTESSRRRLGEFLSTTLDETERTVFTLHYGDDMPLDAITRMLSLENASGAKAYIVSAKRKLSRAVERMKALGRTL